MIPSFLRMGYYQLLHYPMAINGWLYKNFRCPSSSLKVHLGPGQGKYIEGWLNVDANFISAKIDLWANLMNPLPFRDNSVEVFYSHHVIEHLPDWYLPQHFQQMFQALSPGGGVRIGAPHAGNAYRKYVEGDINWFSSDFPTKRSSLVGRLTNFILCAGEHRTCLDETYLTELAEGAGFKQLRFKLVGKESDIVGSEVLDLEDVEWDLNCPHTVILEAIKSLG
jgi:predicted SAM-dependent methyltransferase